jgi:hypothetical protein
VTLVLQWRVRVLDGGIKTSDINYGEESGSHGKCSRSLIERF